MWEGPSLACSLGAGKWQGWGQDRDPGVPSWGTSSTLNLCPLRSGSPLKPTNLSPPFNKHSRALSKQGTARRSGLEVTHTCESHPTATWQSTGSEGTRDHLEPRLKSAVSKSSTTSPSQHAPCGFVSFAKLLNHSIPCLTLLIRKMGR